MGDVTRREAVIDFASRMHQAPQTSRVVKFGPFEADLRTRELRKQGIRIRLQDQPFQILAMVMERPGELVTREEIRAKLWPEDTFVDFDHGLNAAVRRLRDALNDSADAPRYIETLPRRGYRFIGVAQTAPDMAHPSEPDAPVPNRLTWLSVLRARRLVLPVVLASLAIGSFLGWHLWRRPARIDSVAVLPFAAQGPDLQYLGDGIAEALTDNLSGIGTLRVVAHNSAFQVAAQNLSTQEIARRLDVAGLVVGAVRREGENLRISAELVDAHNDRHLWGEEIEFQRSQLLTSQPALARQVFEGLRLKLDPDFRLRRMPGGTDNPEAYDAYLRAEYELRRHDTASLQQALANLQRAIALDPNFAAAYAQLEPVYGILIVYLRQKRYQDVLSIVDSVSQNPDAEPPIEWLAGSTMESCRILRFKAYLGSGKREEAMQVLQELLALYRSQPFEPSILAAMYAELGDRKNAYKWLETQENEQGPDPRWIASDHGFDGLRSDPQFKKLIQRLETPR